MNINFSRRRILLTVFNLLISTVTVMSQKVLSKDKLQIQKLIQQMTVEEKTAQLCSKSIYLLLTKEGNFDSVAAQKLIPNGIGHLLSSRNANAGKAVQDLQNWLQTKTRLGIPAIVHGEAITGNPVISATTLPQQIGMGCTWNPELLEKNTMATRMQMRAVGMNQALSPMLDVGYDARWGRNEEGFGEDPYLTSRMGLAFVRGMQGDNLREGVAATVKHFAGYAQQKINQDKFTNNAINRDDSAVARFREDVLTPFEVAVKLGNVAAVMPGYHNLGGVSCSASSYLLTDILRKEWGFKGDVPSDYGSIKRSKPDSMEALIECLRAGVDVDLPTGDIYKFIPQALAAKRINEKMVNDAVSHILAVKESLGLLDKVPFVIGNGTIPNLDGPADRQRAYESACQSIVLLKNNGILPIGKNIHSIAVIGPNANSAYSLLGDYTPQTLGEFWSKTPFDPSKPNLITLLAGLKNRASQQLNIEFERGFDWVKGLGDNETQIVIEDELAKNAAKRPLQPEPKPNWANAKAIAQKSDLIIVAVGENRYLCGETRDRSDITLPGEQQQRVKELIATGKPVVLVLFGGRANAIGEIANGCKAIIQAWYPGEEGGNAVADLLLGNFNPSGKLSFTMPASSNQCPIGYRQGYNSNNPPLYPFGHGISYTTYQYKNLNIVSKNKTSDKKIPVSFTLTNTGFRTGVEIAQLYVSSSIGKSRGVALELKGFERVKLLPNETRKVTLLLSPQQLATYNAKQDIWEILPGSYQIKIGASSTDIKLTGDIMLTGEKVSLQSRTVFFSETSTSHP